MSDSSELPLLYASIFILCIGSYDKFTKLQDNERVELCDKEE